MQKTLTIGYIKPEFFGYPNTACKVTVEIEIKQKAHPQKDLWLNEVQKPICLSIHGDVKHGKSYVCSGQINNTLEEALQEKAFRKLAIPENTLRTLLEIWQKWHLNDLRAYCTHQKELVSQYPEKFFYADNYDNIVKEPEFTKCSKCGYRYGTAWLYEPLPQDVTNFLEKL